MVGSRTRVKAWWGSRGGRGLWVVGLRGGRVVGYSSGRILGVVGV